MEYLEVALSALFSLAVLFILTKLMGKRQVSQLTMFDYIIGISIGSIAAQTATDLENPINGIIAMSVYAFSACIISYITAKFLPFRRAVFGKSTLLVSGGKLCQNNFKKSKLDLGEFLMQCRTAGYFDVSDIAYAALEPNGKISFLPRSAKRPATPEDLNLVPGEDTLPYNVIVDGTVMEKNLKGLGFNDQWLKNALKVQGYKNTKSIFLASADKNGTLTVYDCCEELTHNDPFE